MMAITYVQGDLFDFVLAEQNKTVIIPHVCNDKGKWGKGFVLPLGKQCPEAKDAYLAWFAGQHLSDDFEILTNCTRPFEIGAVQMVQSVAGVIVANMVAQTLGGSRPLRYNCLSRCMDEVADTALYNFGSDGICFICPKFGSGLAGGNWNFIEQLIEDCWVQRNIDVICAVKQII